MIKLTKKQALAYQRRWKQLKLIQIQEFRTAPLSLKFKQLCLLMNSFYSPFKGKEEEKRLDIIRKRWVTLKIKWENSG